MTARITPFGTTPEGEAVDRISLSGGGLQAEILTYGLILQDLRLDGVAHPLVLGAGALAPYLGPMRYFGAMVGRFANRIAGGRFTIDGVTHQVPCNNGPNALHGGPVGAGEKVWTLVDAEADRARFALTLPDGDMGFPGDLSVTAEVTLADGAIGFDLAATTTAPTPVSFAHHSYFNLDDSADVRDHRLTVNAGHYLPVDTGLIPTGEIRPVAGTPFDFRSPAPVRGCALDHNFCLDGGEVALRPVARLTAPSGALSLVVETTAPGLQVYDGSQIPASGLAGLDGRHHGPHAGLALETQAWPDAPNHPGFPGAILRPGETYRHQMRYRFERG